VIQRPQLRDLGVDDLRDLAGAGPARGAAPVQRSAARSQRLRPGLRRLLHILDHTPAIVLGRRLDLIAANPLARALCADLVKLPVRQRNLVRYLCLDAGARELFVDWELAVADSVGSLRRYAGRQPGDPRLAELVGELSVGSAEFRRCWSGGEWSGGEWSGDEPRQRASEVERFHHPVVGDLTLDFQTVTFAGDPDQTMIIYTAEPDSAAEHALRRLAGTTGRTPPDRPARTARATAARTARRKGPPRDPDSGTPGD
jgi:hypothetical protein